MKNSFKIFFSLLGLILLFTACTPDNPQMEALPSKVTYEVSQDLSIDPGGNTVILKNTTPNSIPVFDYGTGRSTNQIDTIHFAFAGKYAIKFTAYLQGGAVVGPTDSIAVTANNLNYVSDPLWTDLCGGAGQSKTWIPDNGNYGFAAGPMSYADPSVTQEFEKYAINWDPGVSTDGATANDLACTMTFDLKGGAHLTVVKPNESGVPLTGGYFLDVTNHTLTTTDVTVDRIASRIAEVTNWNSNLKILELTPDQFRIAVYRTDPKQGPWWDVYSYVSKAYADSYTPPTPKVDDGYNPTFKPGEILAMLAGDAGQARRWVLDAAGNPVDWIAAGKGWTTSKSSSETWGWDSDWDNAAANSWIQFDRFGGQNYTIDQNGVISTGTFTCDEKTNEVILSPSSLTLIKSGTGSWMDPSTNILTIVKGWPSAYETNGVWFGVSYTASSDQWLAFHYVVSQ